jgi:hypothetical protein
MARPKGVAELPRALQGGALRYFKEEEAKGRPLSVIWREMMEKDEFRTMDLILKVMPKELLLDVEQTVTLDTTQISNEVLANLFDLQEADEAATLPIH